jgi:acyl carrier protein
MTNLERFTQCFAASLNIAPDAVVDTLTYQSISAWDSVAHMALVAALEGDFNIMLDTDDIIGMSSVGVAKEILRKYGVEL